MRRTLTWILLLTSDKFNTFFANIVPGLWRNVPQRQNKNMENYLKEKIFEPIGH